MYGTSFGARYLDISQAVHMNEIVEHCPRKTAYRENR